MGNKRIISGRKLAPLRPALIIALLNIAITVAAGQKPILATGLLSGDRSPKQRPVLEESQGANDLNTNLVFVAVTVTDRDGRTTAGLPKESFRIYDDRVEQQISFFSDEDSPASIGILFDTSRSMGARAIARVKEALARFIQASHPRDEFFLIAFSSRPLLLLDRVRDGQAVLDKFTYVQPHEDTALYDAVDMGIKELSQATYPKRAIILISDGEENHSRSSLGNLRREIQESGVVVYTVRVGSLPLPKSVGGMMMEQIAAVSGGEAFWPSNSERMDEAFEQIALDLRRQYSIGYLPSNFMADGKLHRIRVSVTVPRGLSQRWSSETVKVITLSQRSRHARTMEKQGDRI
jgi:Ca-activated chloride channel family protein